MSWMDLERVPEPEVMEEAGEVEAYSSAATQEHLGRIDDSFVDHAVRLVHGAANGSALDIGCGPGQIVIKLAQRLPGWKITGVDRSPAMIAQAEKNLHDACQTSPNLVKHVKFMIADGNELVFPAASFDLVTCNSVLHHLPEPRKLLTTMGKLAKPGAAILLRDLRRPTRLSYERHVRRHGRYYSGKMYELFCASVRSAYTTAELERILQASALEGARVFTHERTHLGVERATRA